jgi:hypothetical protein
MLDLKALKESKKTLDQIRTDIDNLKPKYDDNDGTFWQPTRDKAGNAVAVIRFLPRPAVDVEKYGKEKAVDFVRYYQHSFQGPLSEEWYIEKCLSSNGKKDPVNSLVKQLYDTKDEFDEKLAKKYQRKAFYVSNILVVQDPAKPENNGRIARYRYGQKVFGKIQDAMFPKIGSALEVFDFHEGANFNLVISIVNDFPNYDACKFDSKSGPISKSDDEIVKMWNSEFSLLDLVTPDKFKSYEELEARLNAVLGWQLEERGSLAMKAPAMATRTAQKTVVTDAVKTVSPTVETKTIAELTGNDSVDPDGDEEAFFANLAAQA